MRFTIKKDELLKGLAIVSKAINNNSDNTILRCVKFDLNDRGLFLVGSNYSLTIETCIPFNLDENPIITNYKEGQILLNAKLINDAVRSLSKDIVTIEAVDLIAVVTDGTDNAKYEIKAIDANEFIDIDLDANGTELVLTKQDFSTLVAQTAFAASIKDARAILTAINLEACNGCLTATTTDSARMARKQFEISEDINFIANVPAKTLVEISHLIDNEEFVNMHFNEERALFTFGRTTIASSLIAGDYPNTKNIIPRVTNYSLEVNSKELIEAIESTRIMSLERENVVDLNMSEDEVEFSAKSSQAGTALRKISTFKYNGEPLKISFNSEFILSAVKALSCEDVTFAFVGEMKPFVIKNQNDDSVIQIVTPVRTY